jgi:hypothetical protein
MFRVTARSTTHWKTWCLGAQPLRVSEIVFEFVFVVGDAIEFQDCIGGGHGARHTGQRADGTRV